MDFSAVVVEPDLFCLRVFAAGLVVEEDNVCFATVGVKDAGWQTKDGMCICCFQQLFTDRLSYLACKWQIVRNSQ